jgi:hypothetical protein
VSSTLQAFCVSYLILALLPFFLATVVVFVVVLFERIDYHLEQLAKLDGVSGLHEHPEIAKGWLESDIFDLVIAEQTERPCRLFVPLHPGRAGHGTMDGAGGPEGR